MWGEKNRTDAASEPIAGFDDVGAADNPTPDEPPTATVTHLVRYAVTLDDIRARGEEYAALTFDTPTDYERGRKAIAVLRETRVGIEKRRNELNEDAIAYKRRVDSVAKELTAAIVEIEAPLKAKKQAVDDEKERVKREAEEAEKRALEEKIRAEREAEEARLKAEREAEEARLRAEREAEEARLAEERRKLEAERAELAERQRVADEAASKERERVEAEQVAERARLDAEAERLKAEREAQAEAARLEREQIEADRRAVAEAKAKAEREEAERQARIKAEAEAKERAERERVAAEEARVAELERQAELTRRLERLKPDGEKIRAFADRLVALAEDTPDVQSDEALAAVADAATLLRETARELRAFGQPPQEAP